MKRISVQTSLLVAVCIIATQSQIMGKSPLNPRPKPAAFRESATNPEWPQFGGPHRNFVVEAKGLAASWPSTGPKLLWSRDLGGGHSSIAADRRTLYTMYSKDKGAREFVVALDAQTGKTVWEYGYETNLEGIDLQFGMGPHSTPLIAGDVIYTTGVGGVLLALDKHTGKMAWSHNLRQEFNLKPHVTGYACNPLAYKNTVIVTAGGNGQSLIAFDRKTGTVVWKNGDFRVSQSSPILINVDGQEQLVTFFAECVAGMNPDNGDLLWSHPHKARYDLNISLPVWGKDHLLFVSSFEGDGSRALRLNQSDGKTTVKELWFSPKMRVYFGTIIRIGDFALGSSGYEGATPLTLINVQTGQIVWQDRSFPRANFIYASGKIILLDEDGNLTLASLSAGGLRVLAKAEVLTNYARTAPTLVKAKLYLRDQKKIMALDLS